MWAPGNRESLDEIATNVGLLILVSLRMVCISSAESPASQSSTTRSALPLCRNSSALEGRRQISIEIDSSRSIRATIRKSSGSLEMNKHSNANSEVMHSLSRRYRWFWFNRCLLRHPNVIQASSGPLFLVRNFLSASDLPSHVPQVRCLKCEWDSGEWTVSGNSGLK